MRSRSSAVGEHVVQRRDQPLAFVGLQRLQRRVRRQLRAVQHVVGVAASDTGDRALVAQDRVDAATVVGGAHATRRTRRSSPRGRASRAGRRRPARAPTTPPCARCRTRAASTARSSENSSRTTEPFGFVFFGGVSKSSRPACDRWNSDPQDPVVELQDHVLGRGGRRARRCDRSASSGRRVVRLQPA